MTALDWFWCGRNNAVDRAHAGVRFEVGAKSVSAYWLGYLYGRAARFCGVRH